MGARQQGFSLWWGTSDWSLLLRARNSGSGGPPQLAHYSLRAWKSVVTFTKDFLPQNQWVTLWRSTFAEIGFDGYWVFCSLL